MAPDIAPSGQSGAPDPRTRYGYRIDSTPPKRTNLRLIIGLIVGGCVLLLALAAGAIFLLFSFLGRQVNAPYYEIGPDSFPSLYAAVGERRSNGFSLNTKNGLSTHTYQFRSDTPQEDAQAYLELLEAQEDCTFTYREDTSAATGHFQAVQGSSTDSGFIVILDFYWHYDGLTAVLRRGPEAAFQRVG